MRRIMLLLAVATAATATALAAASPSTATTSGADKWFTASATAVAGPNHAYTLRVSLTNIGAISHQAAARVTLMNQGALGTFYWVPPNAPTQVTLAPGHTWSFTFTATAINSVTQVGITIAATHMTQGSDPPSVSFADVGAGATTVLR